MILDACIVAPLFVEHELTEAATRILDTPALLAPSILLDEVANTLWKYAMRDGITPADIKLSLVQIETFLDEVVPNRTLLGEAVDLAVRHRHPVYDCLYLALALDRREPLATADRCLATLAKNLSIDTELIEPTA